MKCQVSSTVTKRAAGQKKLDVAIRRAYKTYGPDLTPFFSAVAAELAKNRKKSVIKSDPRFLRSR